MGRTTERLKTWKDRKRPGGGGSNYSKRRQEMLKACLRKKRLTSQTTTSTSVVLNPLSLGETSLPDNTMSSELTLNASTSESIVIATNNGKPVEQMSNELDIVNNVLLKGNIKKPNVSHNQIIRLQVSEEDLYVLKEFIQINPNSSKAHIWRKWRNATGKSFSISTCRRAITKLGQLNHVYKQTANSANVDPVNSSNDATKTNNPKLLTKAELEHKLADPKEKDNFAIALNGNNPSNSIWNFFPFLTYMGERLNFLKCKNCNTIFEIGDNAPKLLMQHDCYKNDQVNSIDLDSSAKEETTSGVVDVMEKSDLLAAINDVNEAKNFKYRSKKSFKCFAWEYLDLIFYKDVQQPFAQCRYCRSLVTFTNKNGTSSIRKHVSRCSKIPLNSKEPVRPITPPPPIEDDDVEGSNENGGQNDEEDDMSPNMFIPELVYNDGLSSPEPSASVYNKTQLDNNNKSISDNIVKFSVDLTVGSGDELTEQSQEMLNIFDKFKLQEFFEDPVEKLNFRFEAPMHRDDAAYWKLFEYVYYKDVRQHYCRCKRCGVYINFVTTRRRGLARHMRSCNRKFIQEAYIDNTKPPKNKPSNENKETKPKISKVPPTIVKPATTQPKTAPSSSSSSSSIPQIVPTAAVFTTTPQQKPTSILQATLNKGKSKQGNPSIPPELKAQLALNQLQFIAKDLQTLDYFESENFRKFCQNLITVGAECGSHKIDDILSSKDSIIKFVIPTKISKIKKHIRHLLIHENHLNIAVDIYENKFHDRMTFKYYLTISIHLITDEFEYQSYTIGNKHFPENVTSEDVRKAFLKIIGEYFDIQNLENKCFIVVRDDNAVFNEAFKIYNCLPNVGYNLKKLINNLLLSDEVNPEIHANLKRIQELFAYMNTNYNYHSTSSDSALEQMEEYYEMYKSIEKLLKEKNDVHRMASISRHSVKTVINLLEMIKLCQDTLNESNITISGILLWEKKLLEHYTPALHEHKFTEDLKRVTLKMLEAKFHTEYDLYKIALFLNPNFKMLKFLSPPEKDYVYMKASEMIEEIKIDESNAQISNELITNDSDGDEQPSSTKRIKSERVFEKYMDQSSQAKVKAIESVDDEIARYANDSRVYNTCDDLLDFWRRSTNFPNLRKLAKKILAIPTSSHGVNETVLLKANKSYRDVYGQKMLSIEEYNQIIFINCNFDLVENSL